MGIGFTIASAYWKILWEVIGILRLTGYINRRWGRSGQDFRVLRGLEGVAVALG